MTPQALIDLLLHKSFLAFFLGSFVGLVTISNPFSKVPLFMSLTVDMPRPLQLSNARRAAVYAFAILTVCLFCGTFILETFGISVGALRVAGGLTAAAIGYRMLFSDGTPPVPTRAGSQDIAFFPLAFPGISGPGTLALMIGISTEIAEIRVVTTKAIAYGATLLSAAATCLVMWAAFRSARAVSRLIGPAGLDAMTRMMGFLLVCIGVQLVGSGVRSFMSGV